MNAQPTTPANLVNDLPQFASQIKDYGITEVFVYENEVYITSIYTLDKSLCDAIELDAFMLHYSQMELYTVRKIKKERYFNMDIESAMCPEEKALTKVIAQKFADINTEIKKRYDEKKAARKAETMQTTTEPTPQPETLKVGQVIQGEKCRLVVTKVADDMPQWAKEKSQKTFSANGKTWVAFGNFDILLSELSKFDSYDGMIKYVDGGYLDEKTTQNPKYEATGNGSYFTFSNDSCFVSVDLESKEISGKCYKDHNNEPRFYNQTSKGIKKALLALQNGFNENTTMFEAARLCAPFVRCRSYYAMD